MRDFIGELLTDMYYILIDWVWGNSKFVVPETLTIDRGEAEVNSQGRGDNKLAILEYTVYICSLFLCLFKCLCKIKFVFVVFWDAFRVILGVLGCLLCLGYFWVNLRTRRKQVWILGKKKINRIQKQVPVDVDLGTCVTT
jgi:hypothetical protein